MASIEKRASGYRVKYRAPDGRQRSQSFARRADADRFARGIETDKVRGNYVDAARGRVLFEVWADQWLKSIVNLRPSTKARDESYLRTHVMPVFGRRPLSSIEQLEVQEWVAELARRRAPATVAKAFQILGKIMKAAVAARLIQSSPCIDVRLPRIEREEMRFLSPTEIAQLADAIDPMYRALVLVASYGGLRIGELAGLRPHRVDLERGRVDVAEIAVEVRGEVVWGAPKTRAGRRSVSLPRPVVEELGAHIADHPGRDLVFPAPGAQTVLRTPTWRRRVWQPAIDTAGLTPLRPHDLRHTAVALWIAAGANVLEVARRAGHTSSAFTMDRYGHLFPEADQALSDRLATLYEAPPKLRSRAVDLGRNNR